MILIVEDNKILRRLFQKQLEQLGLGCIAVENGQVAVQQVQERKDGFQLILMDISMPVLDGLEAARRIRAFESENGRPRVPIVAISGASERHLCLEAGMDDFVAKPLLLEELRALLYRWLPREDWFEQILPYLSETLRQRREELCLTKSDLAKQAGVFEGYISDLESGESNMSMGTLIKLAQALGLSPSEIIQRAEDKLGRT